MEPVLRLATADYTYTAGRVDLRSGIYRLKRGGWQPKVTTSQPPPVTPIAETIDLIAEEPASQLAIGERLINGTLEEAREWFKDPLRFSSRWLEWHSHGETEAAGGLPGKRALIYDGQLALNMPDGFDGGFVNGAAYARLTLLRHPLWENTIYGTWGAPGYPTVWGGGLNVDTDYVPIGTAPTRIARLTVNGYNGGPIYRWWFGIRPLYWGLSDFHIIWELEDGTGGTDTTSVVDATASGGDAMECTFATVASLAERVGITVGDVCTTNPEHMKGRYLILLRCKVTAAATVGIQLRWGGVDSDILNICEEVYFSDTNWRLIELGEIQIPPYLDKLGLFSYSESGGGIDWSSFEIQIHAERISGSGYLRLDGLCFMPSSHMVTIDKSATALANELSRTTRIHTLENDQIFVSVRETSNIPTAEVEWSARDWYMPQDPGILVIAAERETQHVMTDSVSLGLDCYARWHLFRSA